MKLILLLLLVTLVFAAPVKPKKIPEKVGDTSCVLCEYIIQVLETLIQQNSTQQQIINAIAKICTILPASIRSPCQQFIAQYGIQLIEILIDKEPPHQACVQLHICKETSKLKRWVLPESIVHPAKVRDNDPCPMCKLFVTLAENYLAANSTMEWIETILYNFPCEYFFTGDQEKQCEAFVSQNVPLLIQWIIDNEDPATFCKQASLC